MRSQYHLLELVILAGEEDEICEDFDHTFSIQEGFDERFKVTLCFFFPVEEPLYRGAPRDAIIIPNKVR